MSVKEDTLEQKQAALLDKLENMIGISCELRSMTNRLVCLGRLSDAKDGVIVIVASDGTQMPRAIYNTEYKLIFRPHGEATFVLCGKISGSSTTFWKLDRFYVFNFTENRAYFRQPVSIQIYASCINALYQPEHQTGQMISAKPCRVADISLEGIRIYGEEGFQVGDWLLLSDLKLLPEAKQGNFAICQVCRSEKAGRKEYLFGCRFAFMSEQEQDQLCADIFTLQRKDIQAHRQ